uniref:BTB domain-containing protein n=1 Tax=Globodera rostochiensis TaxID=31243 RepID=A0A914I2R4_GLORO
MEDDEDSVEDEDDAAAFACDIGWVRKTLAKAKADSNRGPEKEKSKTMKRDRDLSSSSARTSVLPEKQAKTSVMEERDVNASLDTDTEAIAILDHHSTRGQEQSKSKELGGDAELVGTKKGAIEDDHSTRGPEQSKSKELRVYGAASNVNESLVADKGEIEILSVRVDRSQPLLAMKLYRTSPLFERILATDAVTADGSCKTGAEYLYDALGLRDYMRGNVAPTGRPVVDSNQAPEMLEGLANKVILAAQSLEKKGEEMQTTNQSVMHMLRDLRDRVGAIETTMKADGQQRGMYQPRGWHDDTFRFSRGGGRGAFASPMAHKLYRSYNSTYSRNSRLIDQFETAAAHVNHNVPQDHMIQPAPPPPPPQPQSQPTALDEQSRVQNMPLPARLSTIFGQFPNEKSGPGQQLTNADSNRGQGKVLEGEIVDTMPDTRAETYQDLDDNYNLRSLLDGFEISNDSVTRETPQENELGRKDEEETIQNGSNLTVPIDERLVTKHHNKTSCCRKRKRDNNGDDKGKHAEESNDDNGEDASDSDVDKDDSDETSSEEEESSSLDSNEQHEQHMVNEQKDKQQEEHKEQHVEQGQETNQPQDHEQHEQHMVNEQKDKQQEEHKEQHVDQGQETNQPQDHQELQKKNEQQDKHGNDRASSLDSKDDERREIDAGTGKDEDGQVGVKAYGVPGQDDPEYLPNEQEQEGKQQEHLERNIEKRDDERTEIVHSTGGLETVGKAAIPGQDDPHHGHVKDSTRGHTEKKAEDPETEYLPCTNPKHIGVILGRNSRDPTVFCYVKRSPGKRDRHTQLKKSEVSEIHRIQELMLARVMDLSKSETS